MASYSDLKWKEKTKIKYVKIGLMAWNDEDWRENSEWVNEGGISDAARQTYLFPVLSLKLSNVFRAIDFLKILGKYREIQCVITL